MCRFNEEGAATQRAPACVAEADVGAGDSSHLAVLSSGAELCGSDGGRYDDAPRYDSVGGEPQAAAGGKAAVGKQKDPLEAIEAFLKRIDPSIDASLKYAPLALPAVSALAYLEPSLSPALTIGWWIYLVLFSASPTMLNINSLVGHPHPQRSREIVTTAMVLSLIMSWSSAMAIMLGVIKVTGDWTTKEMMLDMVDDRDFGAMVRWTLMLDLGPEWNGYGVLL